MGPPKLCARRAWNIALVLLAGAWPPAVAQAEGASAPTPDPYFELDTKNLFGFLEGADVGEAGARSTEFETTGAFGRRQGRYSSVEQEFIYESTPMQSLGYELGAHFLGQDVAGVDGLANFSGVDFSGLSAELRYVAIHRREDSPFQLTLTAQPEWTSVADGGRRVVEVDTAFRIVADTQLIENRLYGAVNLLYTPDQTRAAGQPAQSTSTLGASTALSYRVTPALMFGAEADYFRAYNGLAVQTLQGQASYLGPTLHFQLNDKVDFSAAFLSQAEGRAAGEGHALDLTNFPRQQAKLRLEIEF
jgi:hypothetical protein